MVLRGCYHLLLPIPLSLQVGPLFSQKWSLRLPAASGFTVVSACVHFAFRLPSHISLSAIHGRFKTHLGSLDLQCEARGGFRSCQYAPGSARYH